MAINLYEIRVGSIIYDSVGDAWVVDKIDYSTDYVTITGNRTYFKSTKLVSFSDLKANYSLYFNKGEVKCECGAASIRSNYHSEWCPKYIKIQ